MPPSVMVFLVVAVASVGVLIAATPAFASEAYSNVYGQTLQPCSNSGMALTGYTRTGYCVDQNDDQGSHHICIDLSSTSSNGDNFCTVTGQDDWCSSQDMPCDGSSSNGCPVQNWCVCQWAFASYIEKAGGCDSIQTVVCESINVQAILAYQQQQATAEKYANALQCIVDRCGLDMENLPSSSSIAAAAVGTSRTQSVFFLMVGAVMLAGTVWILQRRLHNKSRRKDSNADSSHLLATNTETPSRT